MKSDIIKTIGYAGGLGCCIVMLMTLIMSLFGNYTIIIKTNEFGECFIEIAVMIIVIISLCIIIKEYMNEKKR